MVRRDYAAAVEHLRRAVEQGAGAGVLANLGFAYQATGQLDLAARSYARALEREPRLGFAWQKLGELREAQERLEEALDCYRRAVALDPADLKSMGRAMDLRRYLADWDLQAEPTPAGYIDALRGAPRLDGSPGLLLSFPDAGPALQLDAARKFARSQWGTVLSSPPLVAAATEARDRPLRIGYLSSDFRHHAVSFLALEAIAAHDRNAVEVHLYAFGPPADDKWRGAAVAASDHFTDIDAMDDAAAATRIARDGIDVLVDLNGYTLHGRPGILAHRPAAVVAGWLGYIGTMGEPRLADYVIGDDIATPSWMEPHFSECIARLPHCFQPNGALQPPMPPPTRAEERLPEDAVVFSSFNQAYKLHPALWDDWCAILRGVPGSVLWLAAPRHVAGRRNLQRETERRGVDPGRIVFAENKPREAHLARSALADLALDTWPYNSGTTASDALRTGVPLLCFLGETFAGRMAGSLLHAIGLPECIARDRGEVVALATALGNDPVRREALRQRLAVQLRAAPLFRPADFARDLERLFRAMHVQSLEGKRRSIALGPAGAR